MDWIIDKWNVVEKDAQNIGHNLPSFAISKLDAACDQKNSAVARSQSITVPLFVVLLLPFLEIEMQK